jgi:hypothetical protein
MIEFFYRHSFSAEGFGNQQTNIYQASVVSHSCTLCNTTQQNPRRKKNTE